MSKCPHCGHEFIEGQPELPLGPFSFTEKLDVQKGNPVIMNHHYFDDDNNNKDTAAPLNLKDALRHPYWKKFSRYCETRRGNPTLKGFCTWLAHQVPVPVIRQALAPVILPAALPKNTPAVNGQEIAEQLRQFRSRKSA